jgi:phosphoribosylanthranilate isomerase
MVMTPHIKICGLKAPDTLGAAITAGASHVGFVLFPKSPRHLALEQLSALTRLVPPAIKNVIVTVDADDALLGAALEAGRIDVIQLHGAETPARVAAVKARFGRETWLARGIRDAADLAATRPFESIADLLLFDAKAPTPAPGGDALPGGNGLRFDWRLLGGYRANVPWGLSGGLDADSVAGAVRSTRPSLVDVSSGVEVAPGVKSASKIRAFVEAVKSL